MTYDDNHKEMGGSRIPMPDQQDFLQIKIAERQQLLMQMIEEGKQELAEKRRREVQEKEWENPYDRLVAKVERRQREDLSRIRNNKQLFYENVQKNLQV